MDRFEAMEKKNSKWSHVYAIVRFDLPLDTTNPENSITVVKVLTSKRDADRETERLKRINGNKGCDYVVYTTRLVSIQ